MGVVLGTGRKCSLQVNAVSPVTPTDLCLVQHLWAARVAPAVMEGQRAVLLFLFMLPGFVFTAVVVEVHQALLLQAHEELFALKCSKKVPPNPVPSVDNEQHCPEERRRWHLKALVTTKLPRGFMELLLRFYWVFWAFPQQLNGSTDSFSLFPST